MKLNDKKHPTIKQEASQISCLFISGLMWMEFGSNHIKISKTDIKI